MAKLQLFNRLQYKLLKYFRANIISACVYFWEKNGVVEDGWAT